MVLTLREVLQTNWDNMPNKWNTDIYKAMFYCYEQKEDGLHLISICFTQDSLSFKGRIIDFSVENGYDAKFGCSLIATGILDVNNDEPMEERWGFVNDFELIKDGEMPIVKRKDG